MTREELQGARKLFEYYKGLADKAFAQVREERLFFQSNDDSNSIATIAKHISGNLVSRWTDFLVSDGEKPTRDRDGEFENDVGSRVEMTRRWEEGWKCLFQTLDSLSEDELGKVVYIRNQGHTVREAIDRSLAHYAYHVGQIVYLGKMLSEDGWTSLSVPKGGSLAFNEQKFALPRERGHFTDGGGGPTA